MKEAHLTLFYSDELGDLGLHKSFSICISFTNITEIFRIKIYLGCAHSIMCKKAYTDLFKPLKTRNYKGDCLICPFIFINIKPLTMLLSPGCLEKGTTEQGPQSSSKIARHTANRYKTARCTVKRTGRGKDTCFKSEREEILIWRDIFTVQSSLERRGDLHIPNVFSCLRKRSEVQTSPLTFFPLFPACILINSLSISSEQK